MNLLQLLKRKAETSTDLRAKAAELETALPGLRADLEAAQAKRAELLLSGADTAVLKAEDQVTAARLAVDRAEAAIAETNRLAGLADTAEKISAIKARSAELAAAAARSAARVRQAFDNAAAELAAALHEFHDLDEAIEKHNSKIFQSDVLSEQDTIALQVKNTNDRLVRNPAFGIRPTLTDYVTLPEFGKCEGFRAGQGTRAAGLEPA